MSYLLHAWLWLLINAFYVIVLVGDRYRIQQKTNSLQGVEKGSAIHLVSCLGWWTMVFLASYEGYTTSGKWADNGDKSSLMRRGRPTFNFWLCYWAGGCPGACTFTSLCLFKMGIMAQTSFGTSFEIYWCCISASYLEWRNPDSLSQIHS